MWFLGLVGRKVLNFLVRWSRIDFDLKMWIGFGFDWLSSVGILELGLILMKFEENWLFFMMVIS